MTALCASRLFVVPNTTPACSTHGNPAHSDSCITVTADTSRRNTSRFKTSGARYANRSCLLTWRSARFTAIARSLTVPNSPAFVRRR